jgi:hypothetical protein
MSDEVTNAPQLRIGLINEILPKGIFLTVDHAHWKFFHWTTLLLLYQDVPLPWNARDHAHELGPEANLDHIIWLDETRSNVFSECFSDYNDAFRYVGLNRST